METKKEIRKRILTLRDGLSIEERSLKSQAIYQKLISLEEYQNAERILCFVTYLSEVQTKDIILKALSDGKKVYAPTVCDYDMFFFEILSFDELVTGYKGILEPAINEQKKYRFEDSGFDRKNDLMIMPGSVFDEECNRIGYGKGFYDRFLASGFEGKTIAVGFDLQVVKTGSFSVEETDIKPNWILTENQIIG